MIGGIISDIVARSYCGKNSPLIPNGATYSKATIAIISTAQALLDYHSGGNLKECLHRCFELYPDLVCDPTIIQGPIGMYAHSEESATQLAQVAAEVLQSNPEGIKSAQAVALAVYLAKQPNMQKDYIFYAIQKVYGSDIPLKILLAMQAFCQSTSFIDALHKALPRGGDVLITTGSVAFPYYFVDARLSLSDEIYSLFYRAKACLTLDLWETVRSFFNTIDPYAQADQYYQEYI